MKRMKMISFVMILVLLSSLLVSFGGGCLVAAAAESGSTSTEEETAPYVGRWKDKPFGIETMTLDLLADKSGSLTMMGKTYDITWEEEKTFNVAGIDLKTADLKLYLNDQEMGTAKYFGTPETLSLNINGTDFLFSVKEELKEE